MKPTTFLMVTITAVLLTTATATLTLNLIIAAINNGHIEYRYLGR